MKRRGFYLFLIYVLFIFISPASAWSGERGAQNDIVGGERYRESELYKNAMASLREDNFKVAIKDFKRVSELYPFSSRGKLAQMMAAFTSYLNKEYVDSVLLSESYIKHYPDGEDVDYMYYIAGLASFAQIKKIDNDISSAFEAQRYLSELIAIFPESKYQCSSKETLNKVRDIIAGKSLSIALFYLQNMNYHAAIHRLTKIATPDYYGTKIYPEVLYRLMEGYKALGLTKEMEATYSRLDSEFPKSKWASYAENLMR